MPFRTSADAAVRDDLVARLRRVTPDTPCRWGVLTAHEMLCHLGDATAMVLRDRPRVTPLAGLAHPLHKRTGAWLLRRDVDPRLAPLGVEAHRASLRQCGV